MKTDDMRGMQMLELFLKRTKGSITVMVTLMLIPTIFFTGFLADLARIKLGGNQAIMAADNYGEAILAEYDYLLKELYGLFAISQNEEGKKAIEDLQKYMKSSFDPSADPITNTHLAGIIKTLPGDFEGFMPYKSADVEMGYELVEESKLSSDKIFSTQVGDFMSFRIAQLFMDSNVQEELMEALSQGQNADKDSAIIDKKTDFDNAFAELLEAMRKYCEVLMKINHYPNYLEHVNSEYNAAKNKFSSIASSDKYSRWREYLDNEDDIREALAKNDEDRTEEERALANKWSGYNSGQEKNALKGQFDAAINNYKNSQNDDDMIKFSTFNARADELDASKRDIESKMATAQAQRNELGEKLKGDATEALKEGIQKNLDKFDELVDPEKGGEYSIRHFSGLTDAVLNSRPVNADYITKVNGQIETLGKIRDEYLSDPLPSPITSPDSELNLDEYKNVNFYNKTDAIDNYKYGDLYVKLVNMFANGKDSEKYKREKEAAATEAREKAEGEINGPETTDARDIPDSINIGVGGTGGGANIVDLMKCATSYFQSNDFGEAANKLMLKFYMIAYDYGMFSNRTTNVKEPAAGEEKKEAVSLTGIKMCKSVNYLYQAEMEYLYGGHKNSDDNLNAAKNSILAFRAIVNMTSTYAISELNAAIRAVCAPLTAFPLLAIALEAVLRLTITTIETAADWSQLKKGESVVLVKRAVKDLEGMDALANLVGLNLSDGEKSKPAFNYDQYLLVMLTFLTTSDQVTKRTGDLITLNVNAVQQEVGEDGALSGLQFDMNKAYTAVEASCTAKMNFIVMPAGFAKRTLDSSTYDSLMEYQDNKYKFKVTRGY